MFAKMGMPLGLLTVGWELLGAHQDFTAYFSRFPEENRNYCTEIVMKVM